jgi:hypothetical protein
VSNSRISLFFKSLAANAPVRRAEAFAPELRYDLAISIGQACISRFHIDRIQRERHFHRYRAVSGFFDSLMRDQGHQCVADLVASGFRLAPEDFDVKKDDQDRWRAYIPRLGLFFIHDFRFSSEDEERCRIEVRQMAGKPIEKYSYLGTKFMNMLRTGQRILFVLTDASQLSHENAESISRALRNVNPKIDFSILQVAFANAGVKTIDHPDVIGVSMDNSSATDWTGVHAGYDEAFRNIYVSPTPRGK